MVNTPLPNNQKRDTSDPAYAGSGPLAMLTNYEQDREMVTLGQIGIVKRKIRNGIYVLEPTTCFCGDEGGIEVLTTERYGIPHRMVLCEQCALIRANPRMDAKSTEAFYNTEYRLINKNLASREAPLRDKWDDIALYWVLEVGSGESLMKAYLDQGQPVPKTVIDFGCHFGGMMEPFREAGSQCYGVEYDQKAKEVAEGQGLDISNALDDLINRGVKADFIIMQDIIEHLTDLRGDLQKINRLLADGGVIHVWTPGLFGPTQQVGNLFQLAHNFQFCGHTLDYVMNSMGFEPFFLDEVISSFWRRKEGRELAMVPLKPTEWVEYSLDQLSNKMQRKLPLFKSICKFTRKERYEYIEENCKNHIPDLQEITEKYHGSLIVVGGGPSADTELATMQRLHAEGMPVMAISRMYPFCIKNGLGPDFIASMDSHEEQEKGFENINLDTIHLMCSVTRPSLFKRLPAGKAYLWDNMDEEHVRKIRREAGYTVATVVAGGGSVAVSALSLGMNLGFSDFHVFGVDCLFSSKDYSHSKGIAGESVDNIVEEVTIAGMTYLSTAPFVMFAKHMLDMVWAGHTAGLLRQVKFYGESLINHMWNGRFLTEKEMEYITPDKEIKNG